MPDAVVLPRVDVARTEIVMTAIARGRWGPWTLRRDPAGERADSLILCHERTEYEVSPGLADRGVDLVASKPWARADDVGHLVFALRDLAAALALGLLC